MDWGKIKAMEAKLQSLKVPELKALLTAAGLSVSGNKPDLIQRLVDNPAATASLGGEQASASTRAAESTPVSAPAPVHSTPASATTSTTSAPKDTPSIASTTTTALPTAATGGDASKVDNNGASDAGVSASANAEQQRASEEERTRALILELEKRKARAAKFGQPLGEAERKLERAIKFGLDPTDEANVAKLNQPLGTRPVSKKDKSPAAPSQKHPNPPETDEQKQHRLAHLQQEKEKALKRAHRFGLVDSAPSQQDSEEEKERKRKRQQRFNTAQSTPDEKRVKT